MCRGKVAPPDIPAVLLRRVATAFPPTFEKLDASAAQGSAALHWEYS